MHTSNVMGNVVRQVDKTKVEGAQMTTKGRPNHESLAGPPPPLRVDVRERMCSPEAAIRAYIRKKLKRRKWKVTRGNLREGENRKKEVSPSAQVATEDRTRITMPLVRSGTETGGTSNAARARKRKK